MVGTIYNAAATPVGARVSDYKINVNCDLCDEDLIVQRCEESIRIQGANFIGNYNRLFIGHDIIDATAAGAAALTGNVLLAAGLMIDGAIDTGISLYKNGNINAAAQNAKDLCRAAAKKCKK